MSVFRRIFALAVVCLATLSAAQLPDQLAAERVLGPHWGQIARVSGMIFSGTVLEIESQPVGKGRPLPLMLTTFRVDRPIAGVRAGEVLTVREWAGAWSMQRPMTRGERLLIFFYPPSRLGLTSPVGGRSGQVALDAGGEVVSNRLENSSIGSQRNSAAEAEVGSKAFSARLKSCPPERSDTQSVMRTRTRSKVGVAGRALERCDGSGSTLTVDGVAASRSITLAQLERAIRRARFMLPLNTRRDHARPTPGN
jgi:hypothetical protein